MENTGYGTGLTLTFPLSFYDAATVANAKKLLAARGVLVQKALNAAHLDVIVDEDAGTLAFPWWDALPEPEEAQAYSVFLAALCQYCKKAARIRSKVKTIESEKYAFRTFLIRLGFSGAQNKKLRRTLLSRLSGSPAFPDRERAEVFRKAQKERYRSAKIAAATTT